MPENSRTRGLSRRSFLKGATAVAGVAAIGGTLAGCGSPKAGVAEDAVFEPGQIAAEGEEIVRGVCRPNCSGFCHLNVHVRDGRVVKTSRAPYLNGAYSRICHRGLSHVQRIYDPERVKYPMRRVAGSERGAGEWERISWDEALGELIQKIGELRETYGPQSVALAIGTSIDSAMYTWMRLAQSLSMTIVTPMYDMASNYAQARTVGGNSWESNERADLVNAKTIIAWGDNATDAHVQSFHFYKEAMQNGTKLVVIDPKFSVLASKADEWIPLRPGTDPALLLGIMNRYFERDVLDEGFLAAHTVAPFLVRSDTGRFLRLSDIDAAAAAAKAAADAAAQAAFEQVFAQYADQGDAVAYGAATAAKEAMAYQDKFIVMQGGKPVPADEATDPDLYGTYDGAAYTCATALSLLRDEVAEMTAERVCELCEITEDTFEHIVDLCLDGPVSHCVGYGAQAYANGVQSTHAGFTMCGLTGNIGKPGACWGAYFTAPTPNMLYLVGAGVGTSAQIGSLDLPEVIRTGEYMGNPYPVKMLISTIGNPLCCHPDTNEWKSDVFGNLDYVVCVDSAFTDTARYSDLVLPCAQFFEHEDFGEGGETSVMSLSQKAIDPPYEARCDVEIIHDIAQVMGMGDYFPSNPHEAIAQLFADTSIDLEKLYTDLEVPLFEDYPHVAFRDGIFGTPTGRMEFYVEDPKPRETALAMPTPEDIALEHLPHWFPPAEAWRDNELMAKYPFHCMSERSRYRVHSQWFSTPLLREMDPEPIVRMNPDDAEERKLTDGQYVECFNDYGHAVARLVYSQAVRPGTLVYPKGWQAYQHKAGSWSELIGGIYDKFGVGGCFMDVVCDVRAWEGE